MIGKTGKLIVGKDVIIRGEERNVAEQKKETQSYKETPLEAFSSRNEREWDKAFL